MSAEQVKKTLESHGSVWSVVPYVVEYPESDGKCPTPRIPDVSLLHNYQYCNDGPKGIESIQYWNRETGYMGESW